MRCMIRPLRVKFEVWLPHARVGETFGVGDEETPDHTVKIPAMTCVNSDAIGPT